MSKDTENKQCQICSGYLFEDDDVVVCPTCGAPHHRDCWQTVGHCGVEQNHGTEQQYDLLQKKRQAEAAQNEEPLHVCPNCHRTSKTQNAQFCPWCGHSYNGQTNNNAHHGFPGGIVFDMYGGIPKDSKIEDVAVKDIVTFVGANSPRYLNRFAALNKAKKTSWNWAAFLFPAGWCLSRKMIPMGILYLILSVASAIYMFPMLEMYNTLAGEQNLGYMAMYQMIESNIDKFDLFSLILAFVGMALNVVPRIICGRFADWSYRSFTLDKIRSITTNADIEDKPLALQRSGGVNLLLLIAALLVSQYLPSIILSLL